MYTFLLIVNIVALLCAIGITHRNWTIGNTDAWLGWGLVAFAYLLDLPLSIIKALN